MMMKAVLMSIQPKWCELIASGKKTVEVRKTRPKIKTPFKVYIYETQGRKYSFGVKADTIAKHDDDRFLDCARGNPPIKHDKNGTPYFSYGRMKVIGEFVCDTIFNLDEASLFAGMTEINKSVIEEFSCVDIDDLLQYKGGKSEIYGWSITNLVIYDEPKELKEFEKAWTDCNGDWRDPRPCENGKMCDNIGYDIHEDVECCTIDFSGDSCPYTKLTRPPQSWCYVEPLSAERDFTPPDFAPQTSYEDAFYTTYDGSCVVWMYYNPDSDSGAQYVTNFLSCDNIREAESKCIEADDFFDYLGSIAKQELADIGTEFFEGAEEQFLKEPTYCDRTEDTMNALIAFAHMQ